ncbi:hypothetical protein [Aquipseudomonas alcaligenes]|uniref:Uncharacterized protein n=1 Tax=Aquipseudomonas alcaligenes TaxID=43263 RepID=A0A1N6XF71_AQUAC|nr:hypothetical protein [Pseudomonas alcaligenes]SIR00943.1 hypothetical protein SAMN05878282_112120 [Pseudomonas alcaligenes]
MVAVNLDRPTYLRAKEGLAVLSARLTHLMPEVETEMKTELEPVQINRLFRAIPHTASPQTLTEESDSSIKGEFIPLDQADDASDHQEHADLSVESAADVNDVTELSFHGQTGKTVTGIYAGSGYHHYRFNKKNGKSFFLRVGKHLIWGIELGAALRRSGAEKGQMITVEFKGKTPIKVLKTVVIDGVEQDDWVDTYRNSWEIRVEK